MLLLLLAGVLLTLSAVLYISGQSRKLLYGTVLPAFGIVGLETPPAGRSRGLAVLGPGSFFADDPTRMAERCLGPAGISGVLASTRKSLRLLEESLDVKMSRGGPVDVLDLVTRYSVDALARTLYGIDSDVFEARDSVLLRVQGEMFGGRFAWRALLGAFAPGLYRAFRITLLTAGVAAFFQDLARQAVHRRLDRGEKREDVLQSALEVEEVQDKRSETLRKYPIFSVLHRRATSQDIPGLRKAMFLYNSVVELHHDPKYYPEPEDFRPERFEPQERLGRPQGVYAPFGLGPRACPASDLSTALMVQALASLLFKYKFSKSCKTPLPLEFERFHYLRRLATPVKLTVEPLLPKQHSA